MSITQIEAEADKAMNEFLAGMSGEQPQPPASTTEPEDGVNEDDFAADDDDQLPGSSPAGEEPPSHAEQQVGGQARPAQPATEMYTPQQLEYERRLAEERGRNAAMAQMMQSGYQQPQQAQGGQSQQPPSLYAPDETTITDEERELYGKDATAYAEKIAKRVAQQLHEKAILPLQQQIAQQQELLSQSRSDSAVQQSQLLFQRVQAAIPELPQITQSQEWRNYLQTPAPGTGGRVPMSSLLETNIRQGNYEGIKEILDIYLDRNKQPGLQSQVSPGRSQVSTPPSTLATSKPKQLAYSKFLSARNEFAAGQMSYDAFSKIEAIYDKAAVENRINYDK